jgi:acetyl-CoA carboxylase carboxyl transferase subunit beta
MLLKRELKKALFVCKHCDHHFRINAKARLESFFGNNYMIIDTPKIKDDPLKFKDNKKYTDRLKSAKKNTDLQDSVLVASGTLDKCKVVVAIFDFNFMGGSMGMAAGEAVVTACEYAKKNMLPLIIFSSSGGARMQEGILSLMQMPRTVIAINSFCKTNKPFLSILTDPTTGGVSASFAMLGDLIIAEKNATIGFAGSRVIEDTIKEKLPQNFQKSEYLFEKGMVDIVLHRKNLRTKIIDILSYLNP